MRSIGFNDWLLLPPPKGFVALKEALNEAGVKLVRGWTDYSLERDIWDRDNDHEVYFAILEEVELWARDNFGESWGRIVADWKQGLTEAEFQRLLLRVMQGIDATYGIVGNPNAEVRIIEYMAAAAILLMSETRSIKSEEPALPSPHYNDKPIAIDARTLEWIRKDVAGWFHQRKKDRLPARKRFAELFKWFLSNFRAQRFTMAYRNSEGNIVPIEDNEDLASIASILNTCSFQLAPVFVNQAQFDAALALQDNRLAENGPPPQEQASRRAIKEAQLVEESPEALTCSPEISAF